MEYFSEGDAVIFHANADTELTGVISRVWIKPAADPYVTIISDDGRIFVRHTSRVQEV